jgi:hypothetical protein
MNDLKARQQALKTLEKSVAKLENLPTKPSAALSIFGSKKGQ